MNFEEMSDFEINKAAGVALGISVPKIDGTYVKRHGDQIIANWGRGFEAIFQDYCNNWADAGPIIEEYGICLEPYENHWCAQIWSEKNSEYVSDCNHQNPKRAAMIVFLMMKEAEQNG